LLIMVSFAPCERKSAFPLPHIPTGLGLLGESHR
jgi:hypothetical protein